MARVLLSSRPPRRAALRALALLFAAVLGVALLPNRQGGVTRADESAAPLPGSLAYVRTGNVWLAAGGAARQLTSAGDAQSVRWTPAGRYLVVGTPHGATVLRSDGTPVDIPDGAWAPDDSAVAAASPDGGIALHSPIDGAISVLVPAQAGSRFTPVAWSPDGTQLLLNRDVLGDKELPVAEEVWLVQRDGTLTLLVAAGAGWPRALGWSPDGRWIDIWQGPAEPCVSCRADGQDAQLVSADGSRSVDIGTVLRPEWLAWSPDGTRLAAVLGDGRETYRNKQIVVISPDSGQTARIAAPDAVEIQPAWSPDGAALAYTAGPAVPGDPFTNLDAAHGYPASVLGSRYVRLNTPATGSGQALDAPPGWASESPVWAGPNTVLVVRWRFSGADGAVQAQLWQIGVADGSAVLLVDGIGGAAPPVNYYGEFGWSQRFDWHP